MKKILAWVLLVTMILGMFAGCGKQETPATEPAGEVITAQDAIEYLKALYPKSEDAMKTPVNFDRMGIIRIGGIPFTVVWTTDLPEEQIKVIVSEDGATVTLDVNEKCESDTPYVLTATITDEQGNAASTTWNCVLPQAVDMVSLVKEAYALKSGESLPYEATLTGKIVSIDTVYNPEYKNITVTIAVEGAEDMPIQCYRLKGEGAENLAAGNIITVTGTLKNYNGTIEFDAGCMLDAVEQGDAVTAPTDPGEILKAAYKLKKGKALPYPVTLTGKVTEIDKPFDPAYNNISVVITVDGYKKYPILCYRLKGAGAEDIALEDTITVTGIIKNYEGTIEFDAGCQLVERISGGNTAQKPTDDEAKILKDAKKLKPGEKLPYIAILTGQVFSVDEKYSEQYKNITVTIKVNGMRIQCYHMKGDDVQKVKVSDTITVSGQIENYNGVIEFSSPVMTDRKAGNGKLKVELGPVDESKTYYAEMVQGKLYKNLYLNGQITSGGYLKTTENPAESVKINVEEVSGKGTRFYFLEGETKKYIEIHSVEISGETKQRPAIVTEPTNYWNYDSEYKVYFMSADGVYCALGTYNDYDTVSATKLTFLNKSTIGKSQYIINYVTETSEPPVKPETPELGINYVDAPVVGTAYKFVLDQTSLGAKLGFTGEMANTYYFGTSEELDKMVDVYLEEATGGYHIYFMKGNTKTYLNVIPRESDATKTNVVMQTKAQNAAPSVYELNTEFKYVKTACVGTDWYLGTYGSNSTISASKTSYISDTSTIGVSQFVTWFGTIGEVTNPEQPPVTPDEPEVPAGPTVVETPVAGTAYKFGMVQGNVQNKLYFLAGGMSGYYMATTEDVEAAIDVYLEETTGGYYLYTMDGTTKTYINMVTSGTHVNGKYEATASTVYTYDAEKKTIIANVGGAPYWFGTRNDNTYTTVGPVKVEYNGFYCQLYGTASEEPEVPAGPTIVETPAAGTAYKFGMVQGNVQNKLYFLAGGMSGYYMATTEDTAAAIDVYLEATTGGYYLYTMDGTNKTYINMVTSGTHVNGKYEATASTVYTYDAEKKTIIANVGGAPYWFGTRNDNTYTTVGPVKVEYNGFYCQLYTIGGSTTPEQPPVDPDVPPVTPDEPEQPTDSKFTTTLKNGDKVVIFAPAYNKALSVEKLNASSYYNKGITVTVDGDTLTGYGETEIWTVVDNGDGTYSFTGNDGKNIAMQASYASLAQGAVNDDWQLIQLANGTCALKNSVRGNYIQWAKSFSNYSTYNGNPETDDQFQLKFYVVEAGEPETPVTPPADPDDNVLTIPEAVAMGSAMADKTFTTTKYKVTGVIDEIVKADYGNVYIKDAAGNRLYVYGIYDITGATRYDALDPKPVVGDTVTLLGVVGNYGGAQMKSGWLQELIPGTPVTPPVTPDEPVTPPATTGGSADFDTIQLPSNKQNGDSSYTATYTTAAGWTSTNSAIQCGGGTVNPQFMVIGETNASKAVCMNGKVGASGSITSPTLNGGISKLTIKYTKMFTDTKLGATITVTEVATGNTQTHTISVELPKDEKQTVYTEEWTLETPVSGEFTIKIVNDCPSQNTGNKDRMTILSIEWEGAAAVHTHEYVTTTTATCTAAGTTTYTCSCGDTYSEDVEKLGHIDENLDIDCDRAGCTSKVAPAADSTLSVFTANNLGSKLSSSYSYYVEGTIVEVLDAKNGIFLISDGVGTETFYIRLPKNAEGVSHSSWQVKLVLGDKIKVYGKINKYTTTSAPNGSYYPASQGGLVTILEQHPHTFGDPTCTEPGYCLCGQSGPAALNHIDANSDNACDRCSWNMKHAIEMLTTKCDDIKNTDKLDTTNGTATFESANFKAIFAKGTASLVTSGTNYMRLASNNVLTIESTSGKKIVGLTFSTTSSSYTDETEAFLTKLGYTYTSDDLERTIMIDPTESIELLNNSGKNLRITYIEIIYEK